MSNHQKSHFQKAHLLALLPVLAMVFTPLFPFVNNGGFTLGLPNVCVWVMSWSVLTTLILAFLFKREPELDDEIADIMEKHEPQARSSKGEK